MKRHKLLIEMTVWTLNVFLAPYWRQWTGKGSNNVLWVPLDNDSDYGYRFTKLT